MEPNLTNYCSVDASNQTVVNPQLEQMLLALQQFAHVCYFVSPAVLTKVESLFTEFNKFKIRHSYLEQESLKTNLLEKASFTMCKKT